MTYSIVARDPSTGEFGIAVQSRYFAVGRIVPWIEAGVGAVASQAFAHPGHGPEALRLLRSGLDPRATLERLMREDAGAAVRQVAIIDPQGRTGVHTGARCVAAAGHAVGANCCAQANMMARDTVWQAMVDAYESGHGAIADRLLRAMDAAEREGGDLRGKQAAALIVVPAQPSGGPGPDRAVDLRVDDHPDPVNELRRLLEYSRAHGRASHAVGKLSAHDAAGALADLEACCAAFPDEPDFRVRRALVLLLMKRTGEARADVERAQAIHPGWAEYVLRLADAGVVPVERTALEPLFAGMPVGGQRNAG